jgi:cystathionine beta-lyase
MLCPSGLSAITLVYIALLRPGDEVLVPVNVYAANRTFLTHELRSWGVAVRLYDPTDPDTAAFTQATRLLWIEAPCSLTFEFPDVRRLAALARSRGVLSVIDNSWGAGIALRPFELGADISVQSLSKYAGGGGDTVMGSISCAQKHLYDTLKLCAMRLGLCVCAGDAASVLKGLNTLTVRYRAQDAAARFLVEQLAGHRAIALVRHPSLPDCPGHEVWRRDCTAAAGLFSLVFNEHLLQGDVDRFVDTLRLFRIGYGWGGPVSLVMAYGREVPSVQPLPGELVRFSVGLESPEDLGADLAQALEQFA